MAKEPTANQVETMISLTNELITGNGELYSCTIALGEMLCTPESGFSRQTFDELRALYEAANALLYRQISDLKTVRARDSFRALAQQRIDEIRALHSSRKGGDDEATVAKEAC